MYSGLTLTKDTATFTGNGDKTIEIGEFTVEMTPGLSDFYLNGSKHVLAFVPKSGGTYQVVVTTPGSNTEEYIPITVDLLQETKKALQGKPSFPIEINEVTKVGSSRRTRRGRKGRKTRSRRRRI